MTRFRHGKTSFRWCDRCGTLILGRECEACGAAGREFEVSSPGDLRPCLGKGIKIIKTLFSRHFGTASFLEGRQILLNKIAGEDRADEIIVDGRVMGALRFDMVSNDFILELRGEGAQVLAPLATRGIVRIAQPTGHLKGKSVPGSAIEEVKGEFATGDPLIVLAGRFICSGVAKVPSEKARTAEKAVGIRDVGKSALPLSRRGTGRSDFVDANLSHLLSIESKAVSDIRS
ncbi:MAG: reductase, partial [Deltaproteobacteria bacterium]|nr:reductase [Deltaproteobacteria bacterium]